MLPTANLDSIAIVLIPAKDPAPKALLFLLLALEKLLLFTTPSPLIKLVSILVMHWPMRMYLEEKMFSQDVTTFDVIAGRCNMIGMVRMRYFIIITHVY